MIRDGVLKTVRALGMPLVDLKPIMRADYSVDRVYRRSGAHYNELGYRVAAEAVLAHLREANITPVPR